MGSSHSQSKEKEKYRNIIKNKPKIKTNSFDMNSLRNLHLNKNLTNLKGF
jgi:hypothetical protein